MTTTGFPVLNEGHVWRVTHTEPQFSGGDYAATVQVSIVDEGSEAVIASSSALVRSHVSVSELEAVIHERAEFVMRQQYVDGVAARDAFATRLASVSGTYPPNTLIHPM